MIFCFEKGIPEGFIVVVCAEEEEAKVIPAFFFDEFDELFESGRVGVGHFCIDGAASGGASVYKIWCVNGTGSGKMFF